MIPILSTTGTLTGQGLGRLTEALSCIVTHEVNGEYELRMTYPVTGERYADIAENLVVWAEPDNLTPAQAFRIYRITRPLNGIVTIYARHIAYDMSGIVVKPFTASTLTNALAAISPNSSPSCPFTITSTRTVATQMKVSVPTVLWNLLGGQSGSFLDIYGGEWDFNNYTAELKTTLGTDRGVTVRYGKNLTKLEQDVTIEATYAGVFPFWYDEESGVLVKLTGDYISIPGATGSRLLLLDLSDEWETAPTEVQLQARANAYITANDPGTPKISWKVNMAMLSQSEEFASLAILEQVMLGDTIHVYYEPMNLTASARAVKLEYDVLLERYNTVTLGRVKQNMAQIVAEEKKETAQNFKNLKSTLEKAIDSATDFITNPSGEMRFIYDANDVLQEIVVLDNPDISQAQSVWRLNSGGYGHSSTGYAGPYTLAITQNGAIVADFITAGTMAGNRVRTGMLEDEAGRNYWNLDTGEFNISALNNFGGRNILKNSMSRAINGYWSFWSGATATFTDNVTVSEWSCTDAKRAVGTSGTSFINMLMIDTYQSDQKTISGKKYVFSIYIKNMSATPVIISSNGGTTDTVAGNAIKRCVCYQTGNGSSNVQIQMRTQNAGDSFDFIWWHPQIEYGEVVTDWNPAPEDKVGNDEIISKINVSPESIVIQASKVDLAGYVTFTNLSTSGQTTINGANITTGLIKDAANKNSWNLDTGALTITDGSISITTNSVNDDKIILTYGSYQSTVKAGGFTFGYKNGGTYETRSELNLDGVAYYDFSGNKVAVLGANGPSTSGTASGLLACYRHNQNYLVGLGVHGAGTGEDSTAGVCSTYYTNNGLYVNLGNGSSFSQVIELLAYPSPYDYAHLNIKNTNYKSAVYLKADSNGGVMIVRDNTERNRVQVGIPQLTFYDSSGNVTATYPATGIKQTLTSGDDLNDLTGSKNNGEYLIGSGATNAPMDWCAMLNVSSGSAHQLAFNSDGIYVRSYTGSPLAWRAWQKYSVPATYDTGLVRYTVGATWTQVGELTLTGEGAFAITAMLAYNNTQPRGIAIVYYNGTYDHNLAVNENYTSVSGNTVSAIRTSAIYYSSGGSSIIRAYAKSLSSGGNDCRLYIRRLC